MKTNFSKLKSYLTGSENRYIFLIHKSMSFYNPNIQHAFEEDKRNFIKLKNLTFASYKIKYRINDCCSVKGIDDLRAKYQLGFVGFENRFKQQNLCLVDEKFPELLADIALEVMTGRVKSFWDFIVRNKPFISLTAEHQAIYEGDMIQDFIELLVYSDIASPKISRGERDFTKIYKYKNTSSEYEFFSLFERLKMYDYLKRNILLEIDKRKSVLKGRFFIMYFKISV